MHTGAQLTPSIQTRTRFADSSFAVAGPSATRARLFMDGPSKSYSSSLSNNIDLYFYVLMSDGIVYVSYNIASR